MTRRVRPLDGDAIESLPDRCRTCLFWELGRPRPDVVAPHQPDDELAGDPLVAKQAWCTNQVLAGRPPGGVVWVDEELAAFALYGASGEFAPRRGPIPRVSRDALLLATLWVSPAHRERGVGRLLVQAAIKEALRLGLAAVEVYGDRRWRDSDCVLPVTWLLHEGFEVATEHPRYPLLRLDTRRTARWTEAIEHAVEEVLDRIPRRSPSPSPAPAPDTGVGLPVPESTSLSPRPQIGADTAARASPSSATASYSEVTRSDPSSIARKGDA